MSKQGYIKLFRQIQDCWLWTSPDPFDERSAWIDLLMLANHADKTTMFDKKLVTVKRGQRITSIRLLAERWHWGRTRTLNFLKNLEADKMIVREADSRRTLITIVNYEKFQGFENTDETVTRQSRDTDETVARQSPTTNNNEEIMKKNVKENNKHFKSPSLEEVAAYCSERNSSVDPSAFFDYYESVGWKVGNRPMKNWKATVRNWERRNGSTQKPQEEDYGARLMREVYEELRNEGNTDITGQVTT